MANQRRELNASHDGRPPQRALSISVHGGIERHKVSRHGRRSYRVGRKRRQRRAFARVHLEDRLEHPKEWGQARCPTEPVPILLEPTPYEAEAAKGEGVRPRAPSVFFSSRRCRLACTKPRKSGWAFVGLDLNSGWHCTATNQG